MPMFYSIFRNTDCRSPVKVSSVNVDSSPKVVQKPSPSLAMPPKRELWLDPKHLKQATRLLVRGAASVKMKPWSARHRFEPLWFKCFDLLPPVFDPLWRQSSVIKDLNPANTCNVVCVFVRSFLVWFKCFDPLWRIFYVFVCTQPVCADWSALTVSSPSRASSHSDFIRKLCAMPVDLSFAVIICSKYCFMFGSIFWRNICSFSGFLQLQPSSSIRTRFFAVCSFSRKLCYDICSSTSATLTGLGILIYISLCNYKIHTMI